MNIDIDRNMDMGDYWIGDKLCLAEVHNYIYMKIVKKNFHEITKDYSHGITQNFRKTFRAFVYYKR